MEVILLVVIAILLVIITTLQMSIKSLHKYPPTTGILTEYSNCPLAMIISGYYDFIPDDNAIKWSLDDKKIPYKYARVIKRYEREDGYKVYQIEYWQ